MSRSKTSKTKAGRTKQSTAKREVASREAASNVGPQSPLGGIPSPLIPTATAAVQQVVGMSVPFYSVPTTLAAPVEPFIPGIVPAGAWAYPAILAAQAAAWRPSRPAIFSEAAPYGVPTLYAPQAPGLPLQAVGYEPWPVIPIAFVAVQTPYVAYI